MFNKVARLSLFFGVSAFAGGYLYGLSLGRPLLAPQELATINAKTRVDHAKELFGKHYAHSIVRRAEFAVGIEDYIVARIEKGLPDKFKNQAEEIAQTVINEANTYDLDPMFLLAVITRESRLNPEARGRHGEIGLMQLKPDTAEWIARKTKLAWIDSSCLEDPHQNIHLGAAYLNLLRLRYDRHSQYYISAYNMGPRRLQQLVNQDIAPKEYAGRVMLIYAGMYKEVVRANLVRTADGAQIRLATR